MESRFEKYIEENRDRFDVEEPDRELIWNGIKAAKRVEKRKRRVNVLRVAASVIAIVTISVFVLNREPKADDYSLSKYSAEWGSVESEYNSLIREKMAVVKSNRGTSNEIIVFLKDELNEIDKLYIQAFEDIKTSGTMDQIVDTIFDTYEKRLQILNQIINEIEKQKVYENNNRKHEA